LIAPEVDSPDSPASEDGAICFVEALALAPFHLVLDLPVIFQYEVFEGLVGN